MNKDKKEQAKKLGEFGEGYLPIILPYNKKVEIKEELAQISSIGQKKISKHS